MRFSIRGVFLAGLAVLVVGGLAAGGAAILAPKAGVSVTRATLANGLRVVVVRDRLAPVVTTEINYLAGSIDAPPGFPGTAHALEHMMFRGSQGLDKDQLAEIAEAIGGEYNADTTETVTQFFYSVPTSDLDVALRIEALRMNGAKLDEADWDKERGAIEQEVSRDLSSPIYKYLSQLQAILFAGTPYEHDALGTRPSFDSTDAPLLRKFYQTWYAPNNAILVIAGDVQPSQAIAQVKAFFGAIPRKTLPPHPPTTPAPAQAKTLILPTDLPLGLATLAYRMPGLRSPDFAAADVLADVIGSQRAALYGLVVNGQSLTSEFAYEPKPDVGYGVAVGGFPQGGDPAPLLWQMNKVIADIVANGVPPDLVAAAKRQELAQLEEQGNDISGLAETWSNALAFQNLRSPNDLAQAFRAVTVADVDRVAKQLLDPAHAVTAILTPQNSGKPIGGKGYGGAESFGGAPSHPVALPQWASAALEKLAIPAASPSPVVSVLPNGLRLIVQPIHVTPTISVYGQIREEPSREEPEGQEGVSELVSQLLNYGTTAHDRLAFQKALDDIAANESAGTQFSLQALSNEFRPGMQLLAENELQPAFPADAFAVVQRQEAENLAGLLQSPAYLFRRASAKAVVPQDDPSLREATPQSVTTLTLDNVRAYWQAAYRPDLTTIVIVGDVTPAQAQQVVADTFGNWRAQGPTPSIDLPSVPPSSASDQHVPDRTSVQDSVVLTESIPIDVHNPDRYMLMLGNTILGGGFSSRLYNDLRVRGGYVYSVESSFDFTRTRATYSISYGADPDKVTAAQQLAIRDLAQISTSPVGLDELNRAKAQTLRRLPMQGASFDNLAALYLHLSDIGLPLDAPQTAAHRYYDATPAQIQAAYDKYLRPQDLARIVKGPDVPP